ncbi:hypothetical protein LTR37_012654 [Vermiconidia calcicola]|uniref:Uncharacterized protein n=1 Tax=Vermiconidia calcicola TaxID=1690605 RepID=A0ACC3MYU6_9PEZI|nr:hypothetical protein LTR37_012654 [Vermiconidia calcicola]
MPSDQCPYPRPQPTLSNAVYKHPGDPTGLVLQLTMDVHKPGLQDVSNDHSLLIRQIALYEYSVIFIERVTPRTQTPFRYRGSPIEIWRPCQSCHYELGFFEAKEHSNGLYLISL